MISLFEVEDRAIAVDRSAGGWGRAFVWSPKANAWVEPPSPLFANKAQLDGVPLDEAAFAAAFPGVPMFLKDESAIEHS